MIYTSYFANRKIPKNIVRIAVCLYPPKWYHGPQMRDVTPSYSILKMSKGQEDYTQRYKSEILARLNTQNVLRNINTISNGQDAVLLCFEKPEDFCHRHILAEWLTNNTDQTITEWKDVVMPEKPKVEQLSLFEL